MNVHQLFFPYKNAEIGIDCESNILKNVKYEVMILSSDSRYLCSVALNLLTERFFTSEILSPCKFVILSMVTPTNRAWVTYFIVWSHRACESIFSASLRVLVTESTDMPIQ